MHMAEKKKQQAGGLLWDMYRADCYTHSRRIRENHKTAPTAAFKPQQERSLLIL